MGQLRRCPLFVLTTILTVAIGMSACVSIFMVMKPLFFSSPPYPKTERIVSIWEKDSGGMPMDDTYGTFRGIATQVRSFAAIAAVKYRSAVTEEAGSPAILEGQQVTPGYFAVYDAEPALGRSFHSSDGDIHAPHVAVISDTLWSREYKRDASVVGRSLNLDGSRYAIIGVMPPAFADAMQPSAEFWTPLQYDDSLPSDGREWGHHLRIIGRLKHHVQVAKVEHELAGMYASWAKIHATGYSSSGGAPSGVAIESPQYLMQHAEKPTLIASLAALTLFLALVCTTVVGLLLVYGLQRRTGQPMRVARRATGFRILRQLILTCALLSVPASTIGILAAKLGAGTLSSILSTGTVVFRFAPLDQDTIVFASLMTLLIAFVLGTLPFLLVRRSHFWHDKATYLRGVHNPRHRLLVVIEVAVSFALLGSAALLFQSRHLLSTVTPGFQPAGVTAFQLRMGGPMTDRDPTSDSFFTKALDVVRGIPSVESAGLVSQLPLSGEHEVYGIQFASQPQNLPDSALHYSVTPGYFEAMQIHLQQGRLLNELDMQRHSDRVVLINATLAKRQFGDASPIGQRIRVGPNAGRKDDPWAVIVGVVDDVKQDSLSTPGESAFYLPANQWMVPERTFWLVLRTRGNDPILSNEVRTRLLNINSDVAISQVTTMNQVVIASVRNQRVVLFLFESFSAIALLLLAIGIYALIATRPGQSFNYIQFEEKRKTTLSIGFGFRQMSVVTLLGLFSGGLLTAGIERILPKYLLRAASFSSAVYSGIGLSLGTFSLLIFAMNQAKLFRRNWNSQKE